MARWRLRNPHYLNVPGTEWEYKETDQQTGRQARKVYPVPRLLDTNDPGDHTGPGEIVVCWAGKGQPRDIVFVGPPTPDMEPLDKEAEAISKDESPKWQLPPDGLGSTDYSQSLITKFEKQMAEAQNRANQSVPRSEVEVLKRQIEDLHKLLKTKAA